MIKNLKNNPILAQQMRNARWPSLRTAVWIAVALAVVGLVLTIGGYVISPDGEKGWVLVVPSVIMLTETLLMVFGPLITAVVAVVMVVRAIGSENYQMIRLSQLSERDIVNGYLAGVLFRLRSLWMITGGLALPLIAAMTHIGVVFAVLFTCDLNRNLMQMDSRCIPPQPSDIIMEQVGTALIATASYVILFIAWNWLAAHLGVWAAFRYRHLGKGLSAVLLSLICIIALSVISILIMADGPTAAIIGSVVISSLLGWAAYRRAVKSV